MIQGVQQLTIYIMHSSNFMRKSTDEDNVMVKLGEICCGGKPRAWNFVERVQGRYVVHSLNNFEKDPGNAAV